MDMAEFCNDKEKKKGTRKKKALDMKKQAIVQGQTPKDLRISRSRCQEAFNRLNPVNGQTPISGIAGVLESYYDDFSSSDLTDLIDQYGSDGSTDYPNFEYYVCSKKNSESSRSSSSYRRYRDDNNDYVSYSYYEYEVSYGEDDGGYDDGEDGSYDGSYDEGDDGGQLRRGRWWLR